MNIEFFVPEKSDIQSLYEIECRAHAYPWSHHLLSSNFGQRYVNGGIKHQQQVIGFYIADLLLDESTLMNICIDPRWQRHGFGQLLLEHYLQQTAERGCMQWWLEVRASNIAAQTLYEKKGFHQVGVRKNYYQNGNVSEDAFVMHKYGIDD